MFCVLQTHVCLPVIRKFLSVQMCSESTGHAEAGQMTHDPQQANFGQPVDLLFSRHTSDPNRAGNEVGTQESSSR